MTINLLTGIPSTSTYVPQASFMMEGIPQSPLTAAAKASGLTPETAAAPTQSSRQVPGSNTATTTSTTTAESSYLPARPGAAPAPAPTGSMYRTASGLLPTETTSNGGPPSPQPGAVPVPFPAATRAEGAYAPQLPQQQASPTAAPHPYTPQIPLTSPTTRANYPAQPPGSTTSRAEPDSPRSFTSPVCFVQYDTPTHTQSENHNESNHVRRRSTGHPSGYVQNPYADEPLPSRRTYDGEEGVWETAKRWVRTAGEKVGEAESEVWRRINK
ncbi:hypothetical protein FGG08_004168 [Glutinoglossum americanum]|uniref:Uncharacterized protein n=1 Tax=Glutinoglossum americanum TaxID=1670608 RepID=A0A9P8HWV9_9PEZI|nr:hypothetical protein FGG08_004168 [Glutinoglossum americanum]